MPPCPLAHWLQRCRTSQTVAFGVWKSTGMTRDWPSQAMMMATKLKHILTRYALMKPHFIAAFVARGPWPTFIPVLNCCCQGYFVIWNLKTHEAERVLSCISAARRRRASMDGRWKHVFFWTEAKLGWSFRFAQTGPRWGCWWATAKLGWKFLIHWFWGQNFVGPLLSCGLGFHFFFSQGQRYGFVELERWKQTEGLSCEATWRISHQLCVAHADLSRKYKQVVLAQQKPHDPFKILHHETSISE